ncbi:MAG: hypothetical protein HY231_09855, partial [Acidobacteria bacterium]|nr:hypothetical protein [Acidobacteriota bacterium]
MLAKTDARGVVTSYSYDTMNRLTTISYNTSGGAPTNRLTSVTMGSTTLNYVYDANGNVTSDGAHSYTYDAENRVVS